MSDDPLYSKPVLKLAAAATAAGELPEPNLAGLAQNPVCGDSVSVTMVLDARGRVAAFAHETKACVLTQAAASILGAKAKGADEACLRTLRNQVAAMLEGGEAPAVPFGDFAVLAAAARHRNRHTCVLLPIDAVLGAFAVAEPLELTKPKSKRPKPKSRCG